MDAPWNIRKEAAWALANICTTGTDFQVERLVEKDDGLRALVEILSSAQSDAKVLAVVLDAISRVLEIGKAYDKAYDLKLDEYDGIDKIEGLQEHPNDDVYGKAVQIIETYFADDQGGDENLAPATTTSNTFAFGVTSKQLFPPGGSPLYNFSMTEPRSPAHPIMFDSSPGRGTFMSE
jgi:importin subunit alpha-6/7